MDSLRGQPNPESRVRAEHIDRSLGGEFTMRKSNGVRLHHKKDNWLKVHHEKRSDGVRAHHEKERWGKSS